MKNKKSIEKNYLKKVPVRNKNISWTQDDSGMVTLETENKGFFNRIAQKVFHKPKISYIHLDEIGSFVWTLIDGKKDIIAIGNQVEEKFQDAVSPLYERLATYFHILDSYGFINRM